MVAPFPPLSETQDAPLSAWLEEGLAPLRRRQVGVGPYNGRSLLFHGNCNWSHDEIEYLAEEETIIGPLR